MSSSERGNGAQRGCLSAGRCPVRSLPVCLQGRQTESAPDRSWGGREVAVFNISCPLFCSLLLVRCSCVCVCDRRAWDNCEIRNKLRSVLVQYGTQLLIPNYGTIPYFKGRVATIPETPPPPPQIFSPRIYAIQKNDPFRFQNGEFRRKVASLHA